MSKKPASLEMALAGNNTAAQPESAAVVQHPSSAPAPKSAKAYEQVVAYIPTAAKKRLRLMCVEHERDLNSYIREGIDLMLAKHGQPSLKEFEGN
ncbi:MULTISPECIES: hypothetical protein [Methylobacterium]|uniref:Uncharacterized protein n=1 Tax=Methylobacterium bullatum TaxID=570505 RepID=A0A679KJL0_9HYPH|nr:hypothetical protein [Methylobacterium sp. Leaf106]KQP48784.1 hypothetical protein ASF34_20815 [Methylobacterium sp. Leaf106]CAA2145542.1 hypothetical protein MBLL_04668 [Methylobacterium bullatum]